MSVRVSVRVCVCRAWCRLGCTADAGAGAGAVLVPQHVRGGGGERGTVALQVLWQGGLEPLAPLPLAHGAALALPLLPRHLQPH